MTSFSRFTSYFIYSLNALLVFLWFYRDQLSVPAWLQTYGRTHVMILHLPIGFFIMAVLIILFRKQFKSKAFKRSLKLIFIFTALAIVLTALAGLILSREGGYNSETLNGHLSAGVILCLITAFISSTVFNKKLSNIQYGLVGAGFLVLIVTGHYGATLTHGENYLFTNPENKISEDSITVFAKAILPVFENKCGSCHNPNKKKGELILITKGGILNGGESGPVINVTNPGESEILKRIHLDDQHDDHMPPSGKPQLTTDEIQLLERWIKQGPDFTSLWKSASKNDSLVLLANPVLLSYEKTEVSHYDFDFVSNREIESLNSPFRTVSQIAANEPALKASYYLPEYFSPNDLIPLRDFKTQLVDLNLAGMPITDDDINKVIEFENLESLNLNNTPITNLSIAKLSELQKLEKISLAGTKITAQCLQNLLTLENLREVFIWNTKITNADIVKVKNLNKDISWNVGYQPNEDEILKLTPPILVNQSFLLKPGETISLKHNLPGTTIRISLDGTEPDSINAPVYTEPIIIQDHSTLKTIATKNGWYKSNTLEYNFHLKGITPVKTELLTATAKSYKAKGAESLTDNQLGDSDNFRDGNWLGFRENKLIAQFTFDNRNKPKKLTLIYNKSIGSYLMPPETIEVWGGNNSSSIKLLTTIRPEQPKKYLPAKTESVSYTLEQPLSTIKIIGSPVPKLPSWHSGKGEKGWLMVSEVIFR